MMDKQKQNTWEGYFAQRWFEFGKKGEEPYTRRMILTSDGQVDNYTSVNERYWQVTDDELQFLNGDHQVTTRFPLPADPLAIDKFTLIGDFVLDPSIHHQLVARHMPESLHELNDGMRQDLDDHFLQAASSTYPLDRKIKTHSHIRVAFIINCVETLPALLPLIKAVKDDNMFELKVIAVDRFYESVNVLPTLANVTKFLDKQGVPCIPVDGNYEVALRKLKLWQADFLIRQSEWDEDFPEAFHADHLDWARLIHIPYTITEKMIHPPNQKEGSLLTNDYYLHVWRYFAADPLSPNEKQAVDTSFVSQDIFQPVGSMKAKMIEHATPHWPIHHGGKRVLWTAHHTITKNWFNFGTFPEIYRAMYTWTKTHQELSVLFNPHPLLREIISTEEVPGLTLQQYDDFLKQFDELPNGGVLQHTSQYGASAASDIILTDDASAFYEMQIQRKPIVALLRKDHTAFTAEGKQILEGVHVQTDISAAQRDILRLLHEPDSKLDKQIANTKAWLANDHPEYAIMQAMRGEMGL